MNIHHDSAGFTNSSSSVGFTMDALDDLPDIHPP